MRVFEIIKEAQADPDVIDLQKQLKALGYDLGTFGPKGDGIDGILGPVTQAALDAANKGTPPNSFDPDKFEKDTDKPSGDSKDGMPAKGPITGKYGRMVTGPKGNTIPHPGVDIGAPMGSPITAPASGKIIFAGAAGSAGNLIELMSDGGEKHRFMHCSKILVSQGDSVKQGQKIGLVGSTGFSTGPHLHWEKYATSGKQLDPIA